MAAARGLLCGMGVGLTAGFLSAAPLAAASDGGAAACPAYPWPPHAGARGGHKVFMQSDCAACHSSLRSLPSAAAPSQEILEPRAAEIVVVHEQALPPTPRPLHGPPDATLITKMLEGPRRSNLYEARELKMRMALPTPVWLQVLQQPYMRTPQAA